MTKVNRRGTFAGVFRFLPSKCVLSHYSEGVVTLIKCDRVGVLEGRFLQNFYALGKNIKNTAGRPVMCVYTPQEGDAPPPYQHRLALSLASLAQLHQRSPARSPASRVRARGAFLARNGSCPQTHHPPILPILTLPILPILPILTLPTLPILPILPILTLPILPILPILTQSPHPPALRHQTSAIRVRH